MAEIPLVPHVILHYFLFEIDNSLELSTLGLSFPHHITLAFTTRKITDGNIIKFDAPN